VREASVELMEHKAFRFGLIGISARSRTEWVSKARRAEALGFSTFMVWDHFNEQLAPIPALMTVADATSSLRIATSVLANDFRHPAVLAKEAATLDFLSEGRFELGIGAGWNRDDYLQTGLTFDEAPERVQRLGESVQIIKGLFTNSPFNFQGEFYKINNLTNHPVSIQKPHPPLKIGGARKQMLTLATREANIVAFATKISAAGTPDFGDSTGPAILRKRAWIQEAAGSRFPELEFHIHVGGVIITPQREREIPELAKSVGLTPSQFRDCLQALVGTEDEIVNDLIERRERYGVSYVSVDERYMDAIAPIVARLSGK